MIKNRLDLLKIVCYGQTKECSQRRKFHDQVPFFSTGTPEEWLKFKARFNRVITGQHMTTAVQMYACARRLLQGQALSTFNNMAEQQPNVNIQYFGLCLDHVNESMFPQKAYITQTRWMRRYLRKPREMKTRD